MDETVVDITSFMGRYSYFEAGKRVFVLQQKDKTTNQNIDYFADLLEDSTIRDSTSFLEYRSLSTWALEKLRIRNPRRKSVNAWDVVYHVTKNNKRVQLNTYRQKPKPKSTAKRTSYRDYEPKQVAEMESKPKRESDERIILKILKTIRPLPNTPTSVASNKKESLLQGTSSTNIDFKEMFSDDSMAHLETSSTHFTFDAEKMNDYDDKEMDYAVINDLQDIRRLHFEMTEDDLPFTQDQPEISFMKGYHTFDEYLQ